jgi:hypothetical protein
MAKFIGDAGGREMPFCEDCGAPMDVAIRMTGEVVLVCSGIGHVVFCGGPDEDAAE